VAGDAITWSLVDVAGQDDGLFEIDGTSGEVSFKAATTPDHETKDEYTFTVRATTRDGQSDEQEADAQMTDLVVTLSVTDINDVAPVISVTDKDEGSNTVAIYRTSDDKGINTLMFTLTGTDVDEDDIPTTLTWSEKDDTDNNRRNDNEIFTFDVQGDGSLQIKWKVEPTTDLKSYRDNSEFIIQVILADDGTPSLTEEIQLVAVIQDGGGG